MYIGNQTRDGYLEEFYRHAKQARPLSLTDDEA